MIQAAQRIGDFEIIRLLGKGGMGEVYEAQQLNPPRRVALKVLAPWLAQNAEALERFEREARVLAQLDHPGIVRIITTGRTEEGLAYYTMQLVRGVSMSRLLRAAAEPMTNTTVEQTTPPGRASPGNPADSGQFGCVLADYRRDRFGTTARIGLQAVLALAHAHGQGEGYLHRDVKPGNLMIDERGQVYLVDFGLTRALEPGADQSRLGQVRGTPWYMSPEQARGAAVDGRSDLYSLGITLYELATVGVGPFTASRDNPDAVLAQVKSGAHLPLRVLAPEVPRELERIILRCISAKPGRRYQSADALAEDLRRIVEREPLRPPTRPWRRLAKSALLGGGAVAILCGSLGGAYFALRSRPDDGTGTGTGVVVAPQPDKPPGYPIALLERPEGIRIDLLKSDGTPLWGSRLHGSGYYFATGQSLTVESPPSDVKKTLIRLDDDPKRRWFEFTVEMRRQRPASPGQNELGLFFGLRPKPDDPKSWQRFFVLQLDDPPGLVRLGTSLIVDRDGPRGGTYAWMRPFLSNEVPKVALAPGREQHQVRVRAVKDRITISVDDEKPVEIDLVALRRANPRIFDGLDPRGALGVWVGEGIGQFASARITTLPTDEKEP